MKGRSKVLCALVLCMLVVGVPSLWAQWIVDGAPICTATGNQTYAQIVSDGAGGAIIVWQDYRAGNWNIYAQRIDAWGVVQWATGGIGICTTPEEQSVPSLATDGAGGAIIAWQDFRSGGADLYAQRVNESGTVQWTANGVAVCTATGGQQNPRLVPDGLGGTIITWVDYRNGAWDIYAQRVNASGTAQWTANGVAVSTATGDQWYPELVSDGAGGAIITWQDYRNGTWDIYAQRVNASGAVQWGGDALAICTATGTQQYPQIVSDGGGGAIVTWYDNRIGNYDIYAQRVSSGGFVQWVVQGVAVCTASWSQDNPRIISDGAGGALITWNDMRTGYSDIYAQRLNTDGVAQWTVSGIAVCTAIEGQFNVQLTPDGAGGAIIVWQDTRTGGLDIYAQRVNKSGAVQWTPDGVAVCMAIGHQSFAQISADGAGGAIIAWQDQRAGNWDIYAQLIERSGQFGGSSPEIHSVRDVPGDQGGRVYLSWHAARMDRFMGDQMSHYTLWRAISAERAALAFAGGAEALASLAEVRVDEQQPVIRLEQSAGRAYFWELVATQDAYYMPAYGKTVATLFDSTGVCSEYHYFQVVAHTTDPKIFWASAPDSGRSVDNLAPCTPQGFAGEQCFEPEGLSLAWAPNAEADLSGYRVYRGRRANFLPEPQNLIASPCDTVCFDDGWNWSAGYYYKLSALDRNGNESGWALLRPEDVTGAEDPGTPRASYLAQNYPNPFNPSTTIAFALAGPGRVSLRVYDATGRLVRVLLDESRSAGRYEEAWDGADAAGRAVASGVYFYRLEAGEYAETRKMVLVR